MVDRQFCWTVADPNMVKVASIADVEALVGTRLGTSDWFEIDQARVDAFARATDDFQFIHTDPVRAARTSFGGTIAHGFLILSLLSRFVPEAALAFPDDVVGVNYGFDKIRFLAPVRVGSSIRASFDLLGCSQKGGGRLLVKYGVEVTARNELKPALTAEWLTMALVPESAP